MVNGVVVSRVAIYSLTNRQSTHCLMIFMRCGFDRACAPPALLARFYTSPLWYRQRGGERVARWAQRNVALLGNACINTIMNCVWSRACWWLWWVAFKFLLEFLLLYQIGLSNINNWSELTFKQRVCMKFNFLLLNWLWTTFLGFDVIVSFIFYEF